MVEAQEPSGEQIRSDLRSQVELSLPCGQEHGRELSLHRDGGYRHQTTRSEGAAEHPPLAIQRLVGNTRGPSDSCSGTLRYDGRRGRSPRDVSDVLRMRAHRREGPVREGARLSALRTRHGPGPQCEHRCECDGDMCIVRSDYGIRTDFRMSDQLTSEGNRRGTTACW